MNEKSKKNNIIAIVITSVVMIPFVFYQYYNFGPTLKYHLDTLPVYEWIARQPFALTNEGYVTMSSSPRFAVLGNLQDLMTACIFILLVLLVYFSIKKFIFLLYKRIDLRNSKEV